MALMRIDAGAAARRWTRLALLVAGMLAGGAAAAASEAENAALQDADARDPGFLFGRPGNSVAVHWLWHRARAESDVHAFVTDHLTLEPRDFDAAGLGIDLGFTLTPRVDLHVGFDYVRTTAASESRHYIGEDGVPFEQETALSQGALTASLSFALAPRGRAIGQYVWIPAAVVPYVGAGGGFLRYGLDQFGEFVDEITLFSFEIPPEQSWQSNGWTPTAHLFGGVDIRLMQRLFLTAEARYVLAVAEPSLDFAEFESIDLSGLRVATGIRFTF